MKPIKFSSLSLLALLLYHCSIDNEPNELQLANPYPHDPFLEDRTIPFNDLITGVWNITDITVNGNIFVVGEDTTELWGWIFSTYPIPISSEIELQNSILLFENQLNIFIPNVEFSITYSDQTGDLNYSHTIHGRELIHPGKWSLDNDNSSLFVDTGFGMDQFTVQSNSPQKIVISKELKENFESIYYSDISLRANLKIIFTLNKN